MSFHRTTSLSRAGAVAIAMGLALPALAQQGTVNAPGDNTTGTYFDYMRTVYARAGNPEISQLPLTTFDNEYELHGMAAESWEVSDDGLTWTFTLREGLVFSDGEPLTAHDYILALQRAATTGYDFGWYWDFAGGIAGWSDVAEGDAGPEALGIVAIDDLTLQVTTASPKPYLPSVVSLWYPVPRHMYEAHGDDWATDVSTIVSSGPFVLESWERANNGMVFVRNEAYTGPWPAQVGRVVIDQTLGAPEVGLPAFLAGDADFAVLNAGQIPFVEQRMPEMIRQNAIFATSYLSFDLESYPFDNLDVRKALYFAINRDEMTETVLRNLAVPAGSILPPGFPGHNEEIVSQAVFDPERAREHLAAAGYPGGEGFPEIEIWYREQGGYNGAITPPMLQYLQAQFDEHLGITMNIRVMPIQDWMQALLNREHNFFLSPYEYDYIDPSNFYGIFFNGGRHHHFVPEYDELVAAADANPVWEDRFELYRQAEQVLIDNGSIVPLVHPIQKFVVSDRLSGIGVEPNSAGMTPLARLNPFFYGHVEVAN
ncbi:MAG: peptide ABC transporter substrate-binding protein [Rubellimicrobium sp.]|nr:peptide ABC transporter substrate-binding protein [Rubellimicrobium sp.]